VRFDGEADFGKAGPRRLADAERLMWDPPTGARLRGQRPTPAQLHAGGAAYVAGYAVECALKAYIITKTPNAVALKAAMNTRKTRGDRPWDLGGSKGHNLQLLLSATDLGAHMDAEQGIKSAFAVCAKWSSDRRYDPRVVAPDTARAFVDAARRVSGWVRART